MFLITGATGTIGSPLLDLLTAQDVPVRAVTRNPDAARLPAGVEVVAGDPSRPETVTEAMDGVSAVFLLPPALGDATGKLLAAARARGVRRAVLLSALAVQDPVPTAIATRHQALEDTVTASGLDWVILRPGMFAANTLTQWAPQVRGGDTVHGPYPQASDAPVHERDIGAVAARALQEPDMAGSKIPLTGPESLTRTEMVGILGDVLGRALHYRETPPDTVRQAMTAGGAPEPMVEAMLTLMARSVGRPATVTGEITRLLGRPPRTFAEWAADHADAFTG